MPRRHERFNVPVEIVRTILAISETGSLTKAGEQLGLSQPAVTSQIKRLQILLGGEIFVRTPSGSVPTSLGKMVVNQARKMLDANDQMVRLGGATGGAKPLRFGISTLFVEEFLQRETAKTLADIVIFTEHSLGVAKALVDGYIDIGWILENSEVGKEIPDLVIHEREESFVWVRSADFVLGPGAPVPLLTWSGDMMVRALTRNGIPHNIVFRSTDYHSIVAALKTGIGLAALPSRMVPFLSPLVLATEYDLPKLPPIKALLCARPGLESPQAEKLLTRISESFFKLS